MALPPAAQTPHGRRSFKVHAERGARLVVEADERAAGDQTLDVAVELPPGVKRAPGLVDASVRGESLADLTFSPHMRIVRLCAWTGCRGRSDNAPANVGRKESAKLVERAPFPPYRVDDAHVWEVAAVPPGGVGGINPCHHWEEGAIAIPGSGCHRSRAGGSQRVLIAVRSGQM